MANLTFKHCRIAGVAASVPPVARSIDHFSALYGEAVIEKYRKTIGVEQCHIAPEGMTCSDLCMDAAERLLDDLELARDSIEALIFVSQTPDYVAPSTACVLQFRLGLGENCLAFDINLACSGYVYGLTVAMAYLQAHGLSRVLLLAGDTVTRHCSAEDRSLTLLASDAGTATIIEAVDQSAESYFSLKTQGQGFRSLIVPAGGYRHRRASSERREVEPGILRSDHDGHMNGPEVFKFSVTEVPRAFSEFCAHFKLADENIHRIFFHQANLFIIQNIAKRLKKEMSRVPISIDRYGNTGAATIPLTMCQHYASDHAAHCENERIVLCGFGIGLSIGMGWLELQHCRFLPVEVSERIFDDQLVIST